MNEFSRLFPWLVLGGAALYLLGMMVPLGDPANRMQLQEFGALAVQDGGRIKPFDSMARTTLMLISGKQTYKDEEGVTQPAVKWVLDVITHKESADRSKVFRIENDQVLSLMGLQPRSETHFRYALSEFDDPKKIKLLEEKSKAAARVPDKQRDVFQVKVLEFAEHLELYSLLASGRQPRLVPPDTREQVDWRTIREAYATHAHDKDGTAKALSDPAFSAVDRILSAYSRDDIKSFNEAVAEYRNQLDKQYPNEMRRTDTEFGYNHFEPFYQCALLYTAVFLLSCLSWFGWTQPLTRAAFWLAVMTLVVHTFALLMRMYLMDRWFVTVTNLYSSAVFIGWGCVVVCLILEQLFGKGIGTLVASVLGPLTMVVAHHLATGDTLEMMRAVLDTNFWLATHVTCVTFGYTATFVAGFLGLLYIVRGVLTASLDKETARTLSQMIYGIVCFATLLSFTGTVLGGIWADQSWGRFWGWDPEENGALLIVMWNALILHARWGGMVKAHGMAVLTVFGNIVTGWSWFGTNQLGVGLHAYGFNNTLATGLLIFWMSQLAVLVMGLLPLHWWASYETLTAPPQPIEPATLPAMDRPTGKRRGKRSRRGDTGYFPGPA